MARKRYGYYIVLRLLHRETNGDAVLEMVRASCNEGWVVFETRITSYWYEVYTSFARRYAEIFRGKADDNVYPYLMRALVRLVWKVVDKKKVYDVNLLPVRPDRVCKLVSPFLLCSSSDTLLKTMENAKLLMTEQEIVRQVLSRRLPNKSEA